LVRGTVGLQPTLAAEIQVLGELMTPLDFRRASRS
jgi:hypothetical protein